MNLGDLLNSGIYEVKTKCNNCGTKQMTKIKKGHIAKNVIENGKCENCGCQELKIMEMKTK